MIERILRASFEKPLLVVVLTLAAAGLGVVSFSGLRRDVFPDLSAPVFNVIVQNAAMGAEELETVIAIPLEVALAGLPEVRRIRSTSQLGDAAEKIVAVPAAALQRSQEGWSVFVPRDKGEFEVRAVGRGRDLGGEVEVISGLAPGERVVVDGAFLLKAEREKARGEGGHHDH